MATNNITFPIYNADGTPFNGLVLHNATFDSVVMSLGDKITGDVYYMDNTLAVTMSEYIEYKRNEDSEAVKFVLVNPPTVVREGIVSDNSELHGMTKYSFVFYHPMYAVSNFPFTDVAVSSDEQKYLSNSKTFNWIGNLFDMVAKLNKNLQGTQWVVGTNIEHYEQDGVTETSMWQKAAKIPDEPLSFDKTYVSEVLKTSYETWEIPFVIDQIAPTDARYAQGKRFLILFGTPSNEILDGQGQPYIFRFGQGVGLKNNSRTPKNNKIVTRIIGYGSENNIPFGYPQIPWYGDQSWDYTINNDSTSPNSYPIYKGIYGGKYVKLIKHPFTRKTLMPSVYYQTLFNKISPYLEREVLPIENTYQGFLESLDSAIQRASSEYEVNGFTALKSTMQSMSAAEVATTQTFGNMQTDGFTGSVTLAFRQNGDKVYSGGITIRVNNGALTKTFSNIVEEVSFVTNPNYDPTIELIDYYDADNSYVNPAVEGTESVEIHQFEDIKPEFTEHSIVDAFAYDREHEEAISYAAFIERMDEFIVNAINENEKVQLTIYRDSIDAGMTYSDEGEEGGSYTWHRNLNIVDEYYMRVRYTSDSANFNWLVVRKNVVVPATQWDDTMDDDGNYKQSYFKMTLPQLDFDLYACASITEEMKINMRSGACIGCTFDIAVDWDDYKRNFYDSDGNFVPDGEQRDLTKYPKTNLGQVTFVVKKDLDTFGTLMPNTYQQPHSGDKFVILGISLPITYVTNAEARLDDAAKEYMRENNVHYYEYPLKFDEHFLATHTAILAQIRNNTIVRFQYGGELPMALYVKQMTVKYSGMLPTYDITLTDDVEIVLNQIGQVTDDVSRMRVQVSELQKYYSENIIQAINEKLSKVVDDVCQGRITFQQGLDSIGSAIFHDELRSPDFISGLYTGRGWRVDQLGNAEFESVRARSFLEVVELLINRMQAQEGDTLFTDNDQIDKVEQKTYNGTTYYKLSLKEKWGGYVTSQAVDNIIKGIINTLAAKDGNVSDVTAQQSVESDGTNKYYTSWMKVINPSSVNDTVATNQICVILYGDASVPAGKNFKPCELMTIARWGCDADPDAQGLTPAQKADIEKRQRVFSISTTDGRIAKLRGVRTPILQSSNYGTTLGILPDFVGSWSIASRLIDNRDYLYAQGIVVGDFIKVDAFGNPLTNYVDCGNWQNNTPYRHNEYNSTTLQWETSDVWHNGSYWRCKVTQPYNNVYYEPTDANGLYWEKLLTSGMDASEVNPNILLRTIFDRGIDFVKEQWSSDWTVTSIDAATDTIVEGRKSLRINMANGQTGDCDLFQVIFGKLKASTWYTVSFNYFATHAWNTFLHSNVGNYPAYYDASAGIIIDGVMQTMSGNNGTWQWPADWTGQRHTMTFKTASDLSGIWNNSQLLFRVPQGCQLALCMPKMEIGEVATAYMANEDDLRGEKGDTGARGKVGRFFYFGGTFNPQDDDPTHVFVVNDAQAPYFEHTENEQKRYHVFNYETNGSYTMAQMWAISSNWNNKPWDVMTNDFKYLITEAIFASFAHFGSAIINGDWMMSCFGIIYDASGGSHVIDSKNASWTSGGVTYDYANAYTLFDSDYPNSSKPSALNFVPYYCVDMLAGAVYQQNAFVKGTIEADSGHIGGFIINSTQIKSLDNSIVLNSDGTAKLTDGEFTGKIVATSGSITGNMIIGSTTNNYMEIFVNEAGQGTGIRGKNTSGTQLINIGFVDNYGQINIAGGVAMNSLKHNGINIAYTSLKSGEVTLGTDELTGMAQFHSQNNSGGTVAHKYMEIGIKNGQVYMRACVNPNEDNSSSAWPQPTIGGSDFQSLAKGQVFLGPSQNYGSYRYAPLYVRLQ